MKSWKLVAAALLSLLLLGCGSAAAQSRFGVIGGLTFANAPKAAELDYKTPTLYHAGVTYQYHVAGGFSIQPSVLFNMRGVNNGDGSVAMRLGAVEVPVALQWGPDLLAFRPFIQVVPFIGGTVCSSDKSLDFKKLEGGIGIGGGIEIWKFQISAHYSWNLNPYANKNESGLLWAFRSTMVSLALLF